MDAKTALQMFEVGIRGIQVIKRLADGDSSKDALGAIFGVADAVGRGFEGQTSPGEVLKAMDGLCTMLLGNDYRVDAALEAKFGSPHSQVLDVEDGDIIEAATEEAT